MSNATRSRAACPLGCTCAYDGGGRLSERDPACEIHATPEREPKCICDCPKCGWTPVATPDRVAVEIPRWMVNALLRSGMPTFGMAWEEFTRLLRETEEAQREA